MSTSPLYLKKIIKLFFSAIGLGLISKQNLENLRFSNERISDEILNSNNFKFINSYKDKDISKILTYLELSKSQLKQDIFALAELNFKTNGYFVEFGATNGVTLSNTYLLEKEFNWKGILVEPAKTWHQDLRLNRNAIIDTSCIWIESNLLIDFIETNSPELSSIADLEVNDGHEIQRNNNLKYKVNTITLNDLLNKYNAPNIIDFLSIDTEGSEFQILSSFDFSKYDIKVICCEHNFTYNRDEIKILLESNGYRRKFTELSFWDDWYVKVGK